MRKLVRKGLEAICLVLVLLSIMNPLRMALWLQSFDHMFAAAEAAYWRWMHRFWRK